MWSGKGSPLSNKVQRCAQLGSSWLELSGVTHETGERRVKVTSPGYSSSPFSPPREDKGVTSSSGALPSTTPRLVGVTSKPSFVPSQERRVKQKCDRATIFVSHRASSSNRVTPLNFWPFVLSWYKICSFLIISFSFTEVTNVATGAIKDPVDSVPRLLRNRLSWR